MNELTVGNVLIWGRRTLQGVDPVGAATDARVLLRYVTGLDDVHMLVNKGEVIGDIEYKRYQQLILQRCHKRTPIAYLTGKVEFCALDFVVTPGVFIPRPETEHVVEEVLSIIEYTPEPVVIDVGTGTGAIAISVAVGNPSAVVVAIDTSAVACSCARLNAVRMEVNDRVTISKGALLEPLRDYDHPRPSVIVSNPPYVRTVDLAGLPEDVRAHEPVDALDGGSDGLDIYRRLIVDAARTGEEGMMLVLELGAGQADDVLAIALATGQYRLARLTADYAGIQRVLVLQLK